MKNSKLTNKIIKVQEFQGEFGDLQRRLRFEEGLEWRRRSLSFGTYRVKTPTPEKLPVVSDIVY